MRMMMKVTVPVERGNAAIRDGTLKRVIDKLMTDLEPESAYFHDLHGERAMTMVFDMKDTSQIPCIAEPLFMELDAGVTCTPVMNIDDLRTGLSSLA